MLKMFLRETEAGGTPEFWERSWKTLDFEAMVAAVATQPLRPMFTRFLKPGRIMLEGGCGLGHYVSYYSDQGYKVIGLDFAHRTLGELHRKRPALRLVTGDVARLPFQSGAFDIYYSGGVVEHFEHGPVEALREARRVLRPDGVLLISVPYYSPLRRFLALFKRDCRRLRRPDLKGIEGLKFFQYAFTRPEFKRRLRQAGLKTVETFAYSVLWGWKEMPGVELAMSVVHWARQSRRKSQPATVSASGKPVTPAGGRSGMLWRLIISEDTSVPIFGKILRLLGLAGANLMMYVCIPDPDSANPPSPCSEQVEERGGVALGAV